MGLYKDLLAYKKGYALAMQIFIVSKKFLPEEKYSLTDQIRRSSRSVVQTWWKPIKEDGIKITLSVN